ncbi:importin-13 [Onthophagus taurus]|uniref:importin-13 n=1 Tax=Onthophagus taurus TaxID=166361 RepID=UPI000C20C421|nr:importin-13 [Onthophagus taurus]
MEYTAENLEKAVLLFYRTEACQQAEAHQWLTEAQHSPQAWSFVWDLLHPQRGSEVQFFGATTLHTKILKNWNEVPQDHYEILKKKILDSIISFAMGPKIVLNRLCIALSAYIIHTVPAHWPKAFEELVAGFQPQHLPNVEPERVIWILLEILTVIPEEFQSTALATSQKNRVNTALLNVSKDILKVVEMCLKPIPNVNFDISNLTTYLNAVRCACAWIQIGGINIENCSHVMELLIDLTCFVYWHRSDPEGMSSEEMELAEVALETLTTIIQHPHTHKYKNHIIKHTADMMEKFSKILEAERNALDPNKDILATIYLLLTAIAEGHSKIFISCLRNRNTPECKITEDLLTCLLKCSDLPGSYPVDEISSSITFAVWYTLQDDILALGTAECAELLLLIKPYYRELVCIMLRKAMFPSSDDNPSWSAEDRETFRCYRQDIADTYMYCYNVLNIEMLDILNSKLDEALVKCSVSREYWNIVESCLHAFGAVAECIEMENLFLPKLMGTLKEVPYSDLHFKVLSSSLEVVGAYSEWLTNHPEMLGNVIPLVVSGLSNTEVSLSATMALKDLTLNCQKYLHPYAEHILGTCQTVLQSGQLRLPERTRLMYSVGRILSILPVNNIMQYLNVILSPSFEEIQSLVNNEPHSSTATILVTRLKVISSLFATLHVETTSEGAEQPLLLVVQNTMGLYSMIGTKYSTNTEVIEVLCGLLKHVVSTLLEGCKPLLNDILQLIVNIYREIPQVSVLELSKTVMFLFGPDRKYVPLMQQLLKELCNITLQMCAQLTNNNRLSEKVDVIEAFFRMLMQVYKKVPLLVQSESGIDVTALFQCAVMCLSMPELNATKVCSGFLVHFITQSRESNQAVVVQTYGQSLVLAILINIGGAAPRTCSDVLTDLILVLNKKYCDNLARWLHTLLPQEGFPSPRVTMDQKEAFIKSVLREKANKRKLCEIVTEFMLLCRGILKVGN